MKKLLIASAIAASAMTAMTANAAIVVLDFDVAMTGVISGGSAGSQTGTGTATITVDDVAMTGNFVMDLAVSTSSTSFGQTLTADLTSHTAGTFDPMAFLMGMGLIMDDGLSTVVTCTDTSPAVFGNTVCSNAPVGSSTVFAPINVNADDLSMVTMQNSLDVAAPFVGNVNTLTSYTLTPPVPVPAAAWLFGSALVGLAGIGRKRKMA